MGCADSLGLANAASEKSEGAASEVMIRRDVCVALFIGKNIVAKGSSGFMLNHKFE
tara:strand:- start:295 stop:462 length:168 start_codon:yes stop_codon:yes gene_type:complete